MSGSEEIKSESLQEEVKEAEVKEKNTPVSVATKNVDNWRDYFRRQIKEYEQIEEIVRTKLPKEFKELDHCTYLQYYGWDGKFGTLTLYFDDESIVKQLKMFGVQGLVNKPKVGYDNKVTWHYEGGKVELPNITLKFEVTNATKPPTCRYEEEEYLPTSPIKRIKVICGETGEEIK